MLKFTLRSTNTYDWKVVFLLKRVFYAVRSVIGKEFLGSVLIWFPFIIIEHCFVQLPIRITTIYNYLNFLNTFFLLLGKCECRTFVIFILYFVWYGTVVAWHTFKADSYLFNTTLVPFCWVLPLFIHSTLFRLLTYNRFDTSLGIVNTALQSAGC